MSVVVGVDVGGTFTDLFHINDSDSRPRVVKVPSTPDDPSRGVIDALAEAGIKGGEVTDFLHGTTIATNAVIERRGAACALITTRGFRDVLEMGRRDRPHIYGLGGRHEPLVARDQRWEVDERMTYTGAVVTPLAEHQVWELGVALRDEDLETIIVSFLHSYANPAHEERAREILLGVKPAWHVVTSNSVLREYYEFERTSTAVVQGYLEPVVSRYADRLMDRLRDRGFNRTPLIMQSNGGLIPAARAGERAAHLIRSGPAAGVIAAAQIAADAGFENVITGDMGGTSFDVSVSLSGRPAEAETTLLGFRIPVRVPMLDIRTIGAGGGSIAFVDRGGILQVGPRSAGSMPGPVAFSRGGVEPTVTDANVVLGRIDAEHPIGGHGRGRLNVEGAHAALSRLGAELDLSAEATAQAILTIVNNRMASEIRLMTVEQGHDPREFAFIVFGGAGPLHGAALMREIEIGRMLLPVHPGVLCAIGCAVADVRHDFSQTIERVMPIGEGAEAGRLDPEYLGAILRQQRTDGERQLVADEVSFANVSVIHEADMAYEGQVHRLRVRIEPDWGAVELRLAFLNQYEREYGTLLDGVRVTLVNARTIVTGQRAVVQTGETLIGDAKPTAVGSRLVHFGEWIDTPIYDRADLGPGAELEGPLIIEQPDTTAVIEPGMRLVVDPKGNVVATLT